MNEYLKHHGVLGMKWHIRRYQNEDGSYKPGAEGRYSQNSSDKKTKSNLSEDYVKSRNANTDELTNKDLKNIVERLNNEKQYKKLSKELDENFEKNENKKKPSKAHEDATKEKADRLSDDELNRAIDRLNKEKQYRQLVEESKSPINRALQDAAKTFASTVFNVAVSEFTKSVKERITGDDAKESAKKSFETASKRVKIGLEQIKNERDRLKR